MVVPQFLADKFHPLDRDRFNKLKRDELTPPYDIHGLKTLRDKAGNERNMRELYRGRAPYELLQNADDAGAQRAMFVLASDGLAFVHDGAWFTVGNFRGLADGWSDKDPNQCIGHKGLGFRSVLDITPAPHLIKVGYGEIFAVKFSWTLNNGHIREAFQRNPDLHLHYQEWTQRGQSACPVMAIPGLAKKQNLGSGSGIFDSLVKGNYTHQFTTMFWLPASDPDIDGKVLRDIGPSPIAANPSGREYLAKFLKQEVSTILPFLKSIARVDLYEGQRIIGSVRLSDDAERKEAGEITIVEEVGSQRTTTYYQRRFHRPIDTQVKAASDTPKAVRSMRDANIVFLVKINKGQPEFDGQSYFHVYFPTEERTNVGFVIHGDFYVKPDRTRLMQGGYNEWLMKEAASKAAGEFLTELLQRYSAGPVFEALSPAGIDEKNLATASPFVRAFAQALRKRTVPFLPTRNGLATRTETVLPPNVDENGFWETRFSNVVNTAIEGKTAFLAHEHDSLRARSFFYLAGSQILDSATLLRLIEAATVQSRPAGWWYECYSYLKRDPKLSTADRSVFSNHRLIPLSDGSVTRVPDSNNLIVCLPPSGHVAHMQVPACFANVFVFVDGDLAALLEQGDDAVRSWVLDRFQITRFEATELLPRAIRAVVQPFFNGEIKLTAAELQQVWMFLYDVVTLSRSILGDAFWKEIGRFPLPMDSFLEESGALRRESLVPAFLAYWPDSMIVSHFCLRDVSDLRRIDEPFLNGIFALSKAGFAQWSEFFSQAGVSGSPKTLRYSRIVADDPDIVLSAEAFDTGRDTRFTGERQRDENRAVIENLRADGLWRLTLEDTQLCNHALPLVLQSLTLVEGLRQCVMTALQEYRLENTSWRSRLWSLIHALPQPILGGDQAFCRGGGRSGHSLSIGSYSQRQLEHFQCLPSSQGPAGTSECFARLSTRRLISLGRMVEEELGDLLLPYVVAENIQDLATLEKFGVLALEDAASARDQALLRALRMLGDQLSGDWGQQEILEARGRWRLVRGAIQEIYRTLNQSNRSAKLLPNTLLASRRAGKIEFCALPLYYAEPGSAIEQAFQDVLPILDADRVYARLFEQMGIMSLAVGQTVDEEIQLTAAPVAADRLGREIAMELAPYLIALINARSERADQIGRLETVLRRLQERFAVQAIENLQVVYTLKQNPAIQRAIPFSKFFLQRKLIQVTGVIQEAHFTLYVAGGPELSVFSSDLDADALGAALIPVFLEEASEELTGLFPRITSRFQSVRGNREAMADFLYFQLGVSREAQETAWAMTTDDTLLPISASVPPPPPAKLIIPTSQDITNRASADQEVKQRLQEAAEKTKKTVEGLIEPHDAKGTPWTTPSGSAGTKRVVTIGVPTPEQQKRGKQGEEEIKRRLQLPGGWESLSFVDDTRHLPCGYDFLCAMGDARVELEVKTFTPDGRVIVTINELREALAAQDDYWIVGVVDDGKPPHTWATSLLRNPGAHLLAVGEFDIEAKLEAVAADVFAVGG